MYELKFTSKTLDYLYFAIEKYYKLFKKIEKKEFEKKVKNDLGISVIQLAYLYQVSDTREPPLNLDDLYKLVKEEAGKNKKAIIDKDKLQNVALLLLSFNHNIITFN